MRTFHTPWSLTPARHCFMPATETITRVTIGDRNDRIRLRAYECVVCHHSAHAVAFNQQHVRNVLARQRNKLQGYEDRHTP